MLGLVAGPSTHRPRRLRSGSMTSLVPADRWWGDAPGDLHLSRLIPGAARPDAAHDRRSRRDLDRRRSARRDGAPVVDDLRRRSSAGCAPPTTSASRSCSSSRAPAPTSSKECRRCTRGGGWRRPSPSCSGRVPTIIVVDGPAVSGPGTAHRPRRLRRDDRRPATRSSTVR